MEIKLILAVVITASFACAKGNPAACPNNLQEWGTAFTNFLTAWETDQTLDKHEALMALFCSDTVDVLFDTLPHMDSLPGALQQYLTTATYNLDLAFDEILTHENSYAWGRVNWNTVFQNGTNRSKGKGVMQLRCPCVPNNYEPKLAVGVWNRDADT